MECRDTQISYIDARVWQSHSRHADLKNVSKRKRPSAQKYLAGPSGAHPQEGLHSRRKIPSVQNRLAELQGHTDLGRSRIQGAQLGWQDREHTEVFQDQGTKARQPQGGRFGVQMTSIAADHLAEP
jgi:hypothetical protein